MKLTFGADPELFVMEGDDPFSAYGMVPGTKEEPHPVEAGAVQVDGMALEFNIDPASTYREFNMNINTVLRQLKAMIPKDKKISKASVVEFSPEIMEVSPKEATNLGCDPDFNAWKAGELNPRPQPPRRRPGFRTASGHIHIGWTENQDVHSTNHLNACIRAIRQLDFRLGIPSVTWDPRSSERRKLYGQAGAFRPKPFGVEYRVLSNFWVTRPKYRRIVFREAKKAIEDLINGREYTNNLKWQNEFVWSYINMAGACYHENLFWALDEKNPELSQELKELENA